MRIPACDLSAKFFAVVGVRDSIFIMAFTASNSACGQECQYIQALPGEFAIIPGVSILFTSFSLKNILVWMVIVSLYYKPTLPHVHKDQIVAANICPGFYVLKGIFTWVQALNPTVKF